MPSEVKARIAVLASGTGSNADKICSYFQTHPEIRICLIITNRKGAGVLDVANRHDIESLYIPKQYWSHPKVVLPALELYDITHIVLAGFLLLIPEWLVNAFPGRIINIHPALLPRHGGQGMYGHHVHKSVKASGELISGITIHEVNKHFDEGKVIFQKEVELQGEDSANDIAAKVLQLEHKYYAPVVEDWILGERELPSHKASATEGA